MRHTITRTPVVWIALVRQAIMRDLQFRSQVWLHLISSIGELLLGILPALILTGYVTSDRTIEHQSVVAVGIFAITTGLMDCFVTPGLRRFDSAVRRGELDLALIRPIPTFFYAVMRWIQPAEISKAVTGVVIVVIATSQFQLNISGSQYLRAIVWTLTGTVVYATFWADLTMLAFWVTSVEPINDLAGNWRAAGQYPRRYFPHFAQFLLITITPAALVGSFPAEQLLGSATSTLLAGAITALAFTISTVIWKLGLRHYQSASS